LSSSDYDSYNETRTDGDDREQATFFGISVVEYSSREKEREGGVEFARRFDVNDPELIERPRETNDGEDDDRESESRSRRGRTESELIDGEDGERKVEEEKNSSEIPLEKSEMESPRREIVLWPMFVICAFVDKVFLLVVATVEVPSNRSI
jgi:hypothetical protein